MKSTRASLIVASLLAGASLGSYGALTAGAAASFAPRGQKRPELSTDPRMTYGTTKRSGMTTARAKRNAVKARNVARNKAAHRA